MDHAGRLALGYAHLVAYGEKGFKSLPREIHHALETARQRLGGADLRLIYVLDRGFDDRKVFSWVLKQKEALVIRVYQDRAVGGGHKLKEVAGSLELPYQYLACLKVAGKYRQVSIHFGFTAVAVEGKQLTLVVSYVPALGKRGRWWLLTNLPVASAAQAQRVVEAYRKRWLIEDFFRLPGGLPCGRCGGRKVRSRPSCCG